ncbi:MAG: hypothetical protein IT435_02320 [Phycisphaerales bacterium]|nr:hypothetical protein [Phycisphaerales bacterium]
MPTKTKADFLTAMGGATTAVGSTKAFTAAAGNLITMSSHGLGDYTGPVQFAPQGAGVLPGGLSASTNYWLLASTVNAVQVLTAAGVPVDLTSVGSGTIDVDGAAVNEAFAEAQVNITTNAITMTAHGAVTGYGPVRFALTGDASALPAPLAVLTDYWLIRVDDNTVKVATSFANAIAGTAIDLTDVGTDGTGGFTCSRAAVNDDFTSGDVTITDGLLTSADHGKDTGFGPVRLTNSGGALPAGLAGSTDYWMIVVSSSTFRLATSKANALAGVAVEVQDAGSGTHSMRATMQTVADQMEQCLDEVLCFPGYNTMPKDVNVNKFWVEGCQGTGF